MSFPYTRKVTLTLYNRHNPARPNCAAVAYPESSLQTGTYMQLFKLRQQHMVRLCYCCNVHDTWECVITALALVDMVIGVDHLAA